MSLPIELAGELCSIIYTGYIDLYRIYRLKKALQTGGAFRFLNLQVIRWKKLAITHLVAGV
jgi:hypothetical protein